MGNAAGSRSRAEHLGPQRRRPQVLDAALQIAADHGVAGVTMAAIAERIGVTRPVVYACYDGRGKVLAALLDRETELMLTSLLGALPPQRTSSIEDRFVAGFCAFLSTVRERPASWRIIFTADQDPVLAAAVVSGRARLTELFLAICEAAARMLLDGEQRWTPESLAEIVGRAAYRTFEIGS